MSLQDTFDRSAPRKPAIIYEICPRCRERPPRGVGKIYCDLCNLICPTCKGLRDTHTGRYCSKCRNADRRQRLAEGNRPIDREIRLLQMRSARQQAEIERLQNLIQKLSSDVETVQKDIILRISVASGNA